MAVKIPALLDGTASADGELITNPANGIMIGSGLTVKQTDSRLDSDPFWAGSAKTQAEVEANNADTDAQRCVVKTPNVAESFLYSTAPIADDLRQLNDYITVHTAYYPPLPTTNLVQHLIDTTKDGLTLKSSVGNWPLDPKIVEVPSAQSIGSLRITHPSITAGMAIVNAGTATPTANAGYIQFGVGTIGSVSIDGVITYVGEESEGTIAYDVTGNRNHGIYSSVIWSTSTGPSWNRWKGYTLSGSLRIPAQSNGSGLDALGGTLTNPATGIDNNSGTKTLQADSRVVPFVTVTGLTGVDAVDNGVYYHMGETSQRPIYGTNPVLIAFLADWKMQLTVYDSSNPATSEFPPATGWPVGAGGTSPTVVIDSVWVQDGDFIGLTQAQIAASNSNTDAQRSVVKGNNISESMLYSVTPTGQDLIDLNAYIAGKEA